MVLTNKFGLPETIVRANQYYRDAYNKGEVDRSASGLIAPPQIDILRRRNHKEMTSDISDEVWSLLGSAMHEVLSHGKTPNMVVEERLYGDFDGWRISGAMDIQEFTSPTTVHIQDYKLTSAYGLMHDVKSEWVQQLNIYKWLVEVNKPVTVTQLTIIGIVRDWSRKEAGLDPNYPVAPMVKIDIPLWSREEIELYLHTRINTHREAEMMYDVEGELPECSPEERWERGSKWVVKKGGAKRASRVFDLEQEADEQIAGLPEGYVKEYRPGKPYRCGFCGVSTWCKQAEKDRASGQIAGDGDGDTS